MSDPISTSPLGPVYSTLWYGLLAKRGIGPIKASRFMFSGNERLGGKSPVEAIKSGRADEVRKLIAGI